MDEPSVAVLGLPGFGLLEVREVGGELEYLVETTEAVAGCLNCGTIAKAKDRREVVLRDLAHAGRPVRVRWRKRVWGVCRPRLQEEAVDRCRFGAVEILQAGTAAGHRALGWVGCGRIASGVRADLVTVGLDSPRLAGAEQGMLLDAVVFAATAADVTDVVASGRRIVDGGVRCHLDVVTELGRGIEAVWAASEPAR